MLYPRCNGWSGGLNPRAHLWGRFYAAFESGRVEAFKTKAYATMADVHEGRTTLWEKKGTDSVDNF